MKKYLFIIIGVSTMISISSCKKLLEEQPKSLISNSTYYKTSADALSAIDGVYAATRPDIKGNMAPIWLSESSSDDGTAGGTAVPDRLEVENLNYNSQGSWISGIWNTSYTVINRANNVIAFVDSAQIPAPMVRRVHAEAKFLRALYYTRLVQFYGAIPLLLTPTTNDNLYPSRTPITDVYNQIISDLQYAEINLDAKYTYADPVNGGRATIGAAKTLLGYVYLVMGGYPLMDASKFQLAADKLNEVIQNKTIYGYDLMANYAAIFDVSKKPANTEAIFSYRGQSGLPASVNAGTQMQYWYLNFTAVVPTKDAMNNVFETNDLRKTTCMARKVSNTSINPITSTSGSPIIAKYIDFANSGGGDTNNDFPILRYADVLMMRAEALMEIGGTANLNAALTIVNQVRTTHGGTSLPVLTYSSQDDLRQKIRLERRREFMFESKRWFDLVRWNIYVPILQANMADQYSQPIANFSYITRDKMLLPLPYADYVANPNLRPQNSGY